MANILPLQDQRNSEFIEHEQGLSPAIMYAAHAQSRKWEINYQPAPIKEPTDFDRLIKRQKFLGEERSVSEDVSVWPREASQTTRLQKGTNHKRFSRQPDLPIHQKLQQYFSDQEPEFAPPKRHSSQDPEEEICAQDRRGFSLEHNCPLAINYAGAMTPGKSQGSRQPPAQRTPTPESPALLSSETKCKQRASVEIFYSAEEDENEDSVLSAKRIKPNKNLKQHRSEVALEDPTELEEQNLSHKAAPYAQDKGSAYDIQDISRRQHIKWASWGRKSSAIPDYGNTGQQQIRAPTIAKEQSSMAPYKNGGPRPINTLAGNGNRNPASRAFNLTRPTESETAPARKRQKIERASTSSGESKKLGTELESNLRFGNDARGQLDARSIQSLSQTGRRSNGGTKTFAGGVEEYRAVQNTTRRKQTRRPRRTSMPDDEIGNSLLPHTSSKRLGGVPEPAELSDDPIQSESGSLAKSRRSFRDGKSNVEVQIRSTVYQGSANLKPARSKSTRTSNADAPEVSPHFAQATSKQQRPGPTKVSATPKARGNSLKPMGDDESPDEISEAHFQKDKRHEKTAQTLLTTHKRLKNNVKSRSPQVVIAERHPPIRFAAVEESDDGEAAKRGDIPPTRFTESKKTNTKRTPSHTEYKITQLFTHNTLWPLRGSTGSIHFDSSENSLIFHDATGSKIPELTLATGKISKIEFSKESSKVVIHQPGNTKLPGGHHIHMELSGIVQSAALVKAIQNQKTTLLLDKASDHLDRTFSHTLKELQIKSQQLLRTVPEDLSLAVKRQQDRWEQKIESKKAQGRRLIDRIQVDEEYPIPDSVTRSGKKRTRSNSDLLDDESSHKFKYPPVPASEFYEASSNRQSRATVYGTRSSVRDKGPPVQEHQKPRSVSPERWTAAHPGWENNWHSSIIYPREGKNKATVDKEDIERLDEGAFLNDNLIEFYLRWLEARVSERNPEFAKRVHFCNTFFYVRLTQDAKGKRGINYEAVARWTAKVDLFAYDYIIVPVNESLHWYLAIICNVPSLLDPEKVILSTSPSRASVGKSQEQQDNPNVIVKSSQRGTGSVSSLDQRVELPDDPVVSAKLGSMSLEDEPSEPLADKGAMDSLYDAKASADPECDSWPEPDPQPLLRGKEHESSASTDGFEGKKGRPAGLDLAVSDLQGSPVKKVAGGKKGQRKSLPTPRKYNLTEPRIITLDSFGNSHSPTCTNLREYLVAEAKAKKDRDITPPSMIGMTAKHIPEQNNYCDCGLYLLSYVEMFLEKGDEFIHGLLQHNLDDDLEWRLGPKMRTHIRNLLFDIQNQQVAENDRIRKEKGKAKRLSKNELKPKPAEKALHASIPTGQGTLDEEARSSSTEPASEVLSHGLAITSTKLSQVVKSGTTSTAQSNLEGANSPLEGKNLRNDSRVTIDAHIDRPPPQPPGVREMSRDVRSLKAEVSGPTYRQREPQQNDTSEPGSTTKSALEILDSSTKSNRNIDPKAEPLKPKFSKDQRTSERRGHVLTLDEKGIETQSERFFCHSPPAASNNEQELSVSSNFGSGSQSPETDTLDAEHDNLSASILHQSKPLAVYSPSDATGVINLDDDEDSVQTISTKEVNAREFSKNPETSEDEEMLLTNGSREKFERGSIPDHPVVLGESPTTPSKGSRRWKDPPIHRSPVVEIPMMTHRGSSGIAPPRPRRKEPAENASPNLPSGARNEKATERSFSYTPPTIQRKRKAIDDSKGVQEVSSLITSPKLPNYLDASDGAVVGKHTKFYS